ncbi:hypothetical protein STEG23_029422, partial [Scotinomys teguina]
MLAAAMLLPGMKGSLLLVQRKLARIIELQATISKAHKRKRFHCRKYDTCPEPLKNVIWRHFIEIG